MSRDAYLAATRGGTDRSAARAFSDRAQRSYSSQQNNRTGQNNQNTGKIKDVKVEEESFEKDLAKQQVFKKQRKSYTPPAQQYGPGSGAGRSYINLLDMGFDPDSIKSMTAGLTPETMAFFGYTPGMGNMPVQLYQMIMEGSIVTPMEAMQSNEYGIGTYSDLEAGAHPMFPGGLQQYYDEMSIPKFQPIVSGGGGSGYGGYGGYGGGGGSGDGVGGYSFNEYAQQGIAQPPGVGPGTLQEQVSQGFLSGMGAPRFSRGGIVSLLRLGE